MNVSQALDDVKAFLENDPLVQAAVNLVVPAATRIVLADVLRGLEAEFTRSSQAAADEARADTVAAMTPPEYPPEQG